MIYYVYALVNFRSPRRCILELLIEYLHVYQISLPTAREYGNLMTYKFQRIMMIVVCTTWWANCTRQQKIYCITFVYHRFILQQITNFS